MRWPGATINTTSARIVAWVLSSAGFLARPATRALHRATPDEGRHEVDARRVGDRARHRLALRRVREEAESVAQPLDRRTGDEHAALESICRVAIDPPRDRREEPARGDHRCQPGVQ